VLLARCVMPVGAGAGVLQIRALGPDTASRRNEPCAVVERGTSRHGGRVPRRGSSGKRGFVLRRLRPANRRVSADL